MVRKVVAMAAERVGIVREEVDKIELAIDEACSNAVLHAHPGNSLGQIRIKVDITESRFTVQIRDGGKRFPFEEQGNFDLDDKNKKMEPGGLGIYIIKHFMDEVRYSYTEEHGNEITMSKLRVVRTVCE